MYIWDQEALFKDSLADFVDRNVAVQRGLEPPGVELKGQHCFQSSSR